MALTATTPRQTSPSAHAGRHSGDAQRSAMPAGWRHSALVAWLRDQPQERRESVLASLFALVAAVWAPLGVLAFLARVFSIYAVVTVLLLVAVAAPRPTAVAYVATAFSEHVQPALRTAWQQLVVAVRHVRREVPDVMGMLREEASPHVRRAVDRTGRAAVSASASIRRGSAHVRERLAELGPSPAQSSPRSTR